MTAAAVLAAVLAAPAAAQPEASVSAVARSSLERIDVEDPGGRRARWLFTQSYEATGTAPLLVPEAGWVTAIGNFRDGSNVARMVEGGSPSDRRSSLSLSARLFPQEVQRYVAVSPFASQSQFTAAWGGGPARKLTDSTLGGTVGLNVPEAPSAEVTVLKVTRRDSATGSPVGQDSLSRHERAAYARSGLRLQYDRQVQAATGPVTGPAGLKTDALAGTLDYVHAGPAGVALEQVQASASYRRERVGGAAGAAPPDAADERASCLTRPWKLGRFETRLGLGQTAQADFTARALRVGSEASSLSRIAGGWWSADNVLTVANRPVARGSHDAVTERLGVRTGPGRVGWEGQAEEIHRWGGLPAASDSAVVRQRVTAAVHRKADAYAEQGWSEARPGGAGPSSRTLSFGVGTGWRPLEGVEARVGADRSVVRAAAWPPRTTRDRATVSVRAVPVPGLSAGASVALERATPVAAGALSNWGADAAWSPVAAVTLDARATVTRRSGVAGPGDELDALDTQARAAYRYGKTTASVTWESRRFASPRPYRRFAVELERRF